MGKALSKVAAEIAERVSTGDPEKLTHGRKLPIEMLQSLSCC